MPSSSCSAALAAAALIAAVAPAAASAHDGGVRWTVAQARSFATHAHVSGVDDSQPDRPSFTVDLRHATVKPLGTPTRRGHAKYWLHFAVQANGVDPDTELTLGVSFVLHPLGPPGAGGYELTHFRGPPPNATQPAFPIRAAFYYAWYPEAWSRDGGLTTFSKFRPTLGLYDSSTRRLAAEHVAAMRYGNIAAGIYSWWGPGSNTDKRFANFLDVARQTPFRWAVYYELEGYGDPTVEQLRSDLHYLRDKYFSSPAYLRIGGRPVVFVYGDGAQPCSVASRWAQANDVGAYIQLYTPTLYPSRANELATITAFSAPLVDGISIAAGDVNGDGRADVVAAGGQTVKVFDGATHGLLSETPVDGADVRVAVADGRVFTASGGTRIAAGDLSGDGRAELVYAHDGHVDVRDARTQAVLSSFDVPGFGDAFVAVGDVDGDGRNEIAVASGRGVAPQVEVVDEHGNHLYGPWPAYFPSMLEGMNVGVGDTDGDGSAEIVLGADGGGSATETWRIVAGEPRRVAAFFAWDSQSGPWGTRVAVGDVDGNGVAEVIAGGGPGRPSEIKVYGGYSECAQQPDDWHQYAIPYGGGMRAGRSTFVVSPGFWLASEAAAAMPRDLGRWRADVSAMAESAAPWQLIISFSEWPEGTAIESADEWATSSGYGAYLDVLRATR
jgi:hypothetical protein